MSINNLRSAIPTLSNRLLATSAIGAVSLTTFYSLDSVILTDLTYSNIDYRGEYALLNVSNCTTISMNILTVSDSNFENTISAFYFK